jgi:hypothetical protein
MNRLVLSGVIRNIKYLQDSVIVYVDDMERGYQRTNGTHVDNIYYTWKVVFANNFRNFITKFFNDGMNVDIDARMRPYAMSQDKMVDGYSCLGLSIQRSCHVSSTFRQEKEMIRDSRERMDEEPDLDSFTQPDF